MAQKKEQQDPIVLPSRGETVDRGLVATKGPYTSLLVQSFNAIIKARNTERDRMALSGLYGIYYCSFAGLLRSGVLCTRESGADGFPEIVVLINDKPYRCRESVLNAILGNEAEYVIHPWKDQSFVYADILRPNSMPDISIFDSVSAEGSSKNEEKSKKENEKLKKETEKLKKEIEKLKSSHVLEIKKIQEKADANIQRAEERANNAETAVANLKDKIAEGQENGVSAEQLRMIAAQHQQELSDAELRHRRELEDSKKDAESARRDFELYKKRTEAELQESRKFVYDPNYDHYYSDILPKLVDSIEFSHTNLMIRGLCIGISFIGILLSCVFVL